MLENRVLFRCTKYRKQSLLISRSLLRASIAMGFGRWTPVGHGHIHLFHDKSFDEMLTFWQSQRWTYDAKRKIIRKKQGKMRGKKKKRRWRKRLIFKVLYKIMLFWVLLLIWPRNFDKYWLFMIKPCHVPVSNIWKSPRVPNFHKFEIQNSTMCHFRHYGP